MSCASSFWRPGSDISSQRHVPGSLGSWSPPCRCWQPPPRPPRRKAVEVPRVVVQSQEQRSRTLWKSAKRPSVSCTQH
eukprot:4030761-Pyramimonas_sp.AAC.1